MSDPIKESRGLKELERQTAELRARVQRNQANCQHDWSDPVYTPYEASEGRDYGLIPEQSHGSDPYFGFRSYAKVQKPCWTRTCKKCDKTETTETTGTKTVNTGPQF